MFKLLSKSSEKISEIKVNTVIKLYTLVMLLEGPKYGYEIIKSLDEKLETKVGPSQIYPFLRKLERAGLLKIERLGEREKKVYTLTEKGREFVKNLLEKSIEFIQTSIKALGPEKVCP